MAVVALGPSWPHSHPSNQEKNQGQGVAHTGGQTGAD